MTHFDRMQALRAIDANTNRATEALRVAEDYARFVRNHALLAEALKDVRHQLVSALEAIPQADRLLARDTLRDVGTHIGMPTEYQRSTLADVAAANWKRAEQALRSLEEFTKVFWADVAAPLEQLRYRLYSLEKLAGMVPATALRQRIADARLYVLCSGLSNADEFARRIQELVDAEVDVVQLRDKTLKDRELLGRARRVRELTAGSSTLFILNDRVDLAVLADADGVHVGQEELPLQDARSLLGPEKLIGLSTHSLDQAEHAELEGADYIGCGPVFTSMTKHFDELPGTALLQSVLTRIHIPAFAIGGITADRLSSVLATGFHRVAVQSAIWDAAPPGQAARWFRAALEQYATRARPQA